MHLTWVTKEARITYLQEFDVGGFFGGGFERERERETFDSIFDLSEDGMSVKRTELKRYSYTNSRFIRGI